MRWLSLSPAWRRRAPLAASTLPLAAAVALASTSSAPAGTTPSAATAGSTPTTTTATSTTPATTPISATSPGAGTTTVSASIAYSDGAKSKLGVWKDIRLTILRNGQPLLDQQLLPANARNSAFAAPKLKAVDLDGDGEAEVTVDVFTAGFDCCRRTVVYHRVGEAYRSQVLDWGDAGYRLTDITGTKSPEFRTADARVPAFYSADARGPLRVMALRGGRVRDISRQAPRELTRDARVHRNALRALRRAGQGGDARPIVAAYAADLVRIGDVTGARATIRTAARRGELRTSAATFSRALDRQFKNWGISKRAVLST